MDRKGRLREKTIALDCNCYVLELLGERFETIQQDMDYDVVIIPRRISLHHRVGLLYTAQNDPGKYQNIPLQMTGENVPDFLLLLPHIIKP